MLDFSFGELLIIAVVLLVVVGPKELPGMLRKLGRGIAKLRNMSWELREQSGIDQVLRDEGLDKDLDALRSLSRGRVVDAFITEATRVKPAADTAARAAEAPAGVPTEARPVEIERSGSAAREPGAPPAAGGAPGAADAAASAVAASAPPVASAADGGASVASPASPAPAPPDLSPAPGPNAREEKQDS